MTRGVLVSWVGWQIALLLVLQPGVVGASPDLVCASKLARLRARLGQVASERNQSSVAAKEVRSAPAAERGRLAKRGGPTLVFSAGRVVLDGRDMGLLAEDGRVRVREGLATLGKHWGILRPGEKPPYPLYVVLDPQAPMKEQARFLGELGEPWDVRLVVRVPAPRAAPLEASEELREVSSGILRMDGAERALAVAKLAAAVVKHCAPLQELFGAPRGAPPNERTRSLLAGAADAAVTCGCQRVDVDALEATVVLATAALPTWRWLPWSRSAIATTTPRPSDETVAALVARLVEAEPTLKVPDPLNRPAP